MSLIIEGTNIYLTECGSGSPILFLHGAPDSAEMWSGVIEHLKDHYRCFALDLPGFGRSFQLLSGEHGSFSQYIDRRGCHSDTAQPRCR